MLKRSAGGLILLGLCLAAVRAPAQTGAALPGTLAYIRGSSACVATAAGGPEQVLPESKGARSVSLAPTGGLALYFVRRAEDRAAAGVTRGYVSRMPYTRAVPLPAPLDRAVSPKITWTPDGKTAYICGEKTDLGGAAAQKFYGAFSAADGGFRLEAHPVESVSQNGQVTAWTMDSRKVEVSSAPSASPTSVFSSGQPEPLAAAIRNARNPEKVAALRNVSRASASQSRNWAVSPPALTPDGKRLFFAANAGDRVAPTGNTNFCFFAADLNTNQLAVLSKFGVVESSGIPRICRVSPDNKRLMFLTEKHVDGWGKEGSLYVLSLANQESRDLIANFHLDERELGLSSQVAGEPVWSPDGRYVAVAFNCFQGTVDAHRKAMIQPWIPGKGLAKAIPAASWKARDEDYELHVFDAATTRRVRTLAGALHPSWSR